MNLKETKRNVLKDFISVAGPLGVTHLLMLTATKKATYLRMCKVPRGPTVTMRIKEYSLIRDVQSSMKFPRFPPGAFMNPPLVVMNNFGSEEHLNLTQVLIQNLFPSINVQQTRLAECQRVLLFHLDKQTKHISMRHFLITARPTGVNRSLRKLVQRKGNIDLGRMQDISQILGGTRGAGYGTDGDETGASESEAEDETTQVHLAQDFVGKGNFANQQSAIKLHELGPRLELEVVKVEAGCCGGEVLYHAHIQRTDREKEQLRSKVAERERLRAARRAEQEANVKRKRQEEERKKAAKEGGKSEQQQKKKQESDENTDEDAADGFDDEDWYRQEVGEEPDELFQKAAAAKRDLEKNRKDKKRVRKEMAENGDNDQAGTGAGAEAEKGYTDEEEEEDGARKKRSRGGPTIGFQRHKAGKKVVGSVPDYFKGGEKGINKSNDKKKNNKGNTDVRGLKSVPRRKKD